MGLRSVTQPPSNLGQRPRWLRLSSTLVWSQRHRYNTRVQDGLARRLGVAFTERPGRDPSKRPVREIVGIPPGLVRHFSKRRAAIEDRYAELTTEFRHSHGREPDRSTQLRLAQQATLETRDGKGIPRTMADLVADWTTEATTLLGPHGLERMLETTLHRPLVTRSLGTEELDPLARQVVVTVSEQRSTWTRWNVYAETERTLRPYRFPTPEERDMATEAVVARATEAVCRSGSANPTWSPNPTAAAGQRRAVRVPPARRRAVHHQPDPRRRRVPGRGRGHPRPRGSTAGRGGRPRGPRDEHRRRFG